MAKIWSYLVVAVVVIALPGAGCNETSTEIVDTPVSVETDDTLPDGFVRDNRPANPPATFSPDCPWDEVVDSQNNPWLVSGGQPDQITSIDSPSFVPVSEAGYMLNAETVIACEIDGVVRAFPVRILLYNEIVNMCWETRSGPVFSFVTYCPLVDVGIHFVHPPHECYKPRRHSFGVSGLLYNGNLVFYDRSTLPRTGSGSPDMYVQMLSGGLNGTCAAVEPVFAAMAWVMFERLYPGGFVLSDDTGAVPPGGYDLFDNPYRDYWNTGDLWFPARFDDDRLGNYMTSVYGVLGPRTKKAYTAGGVDYVKNDELDGVRIVVWNDGHLGSTMAFQPLADGTDLTFEFLGRESRGLPLYRDGETGSIWTFDGIAVEGPLAGRRLPRVVAYRSFWFAWASMFPGTELFVADP